MGLTSSWSVTIARTLARLGSVRLGSSSLGFTRRPRRQVRGPFRSFRHEHSFAPDAAATVMVDTLTIASPIFGRLAERLVLVPYLRRLIRRRNAYLLAALDATAGADRESPSEANGWT